MVTIAFPMLPPPRLNMICCRVLHFVSSSATFCSLKNGRTILVIALGSRMLPASSYLPSCEKAGKPKSSSPGKENAAAHRQTVP